MQDYHSFNKNVADGVWMFEFTVKSLKTATNLSICILDGDFVLSKDNQVEELKNSSMGINLNGNKHFSKLNSIKKLKLNDTLTVLINQTNLQLEYYVNGEAILKSKGKNAKVLQQKNLLLLILGDKENSWKLNWIKTSEHVKGSTNKPDEHKLYCSKLHELAR